MSVGYSVTAADVNNKAASIAQACWDSLNDANRFYKWLTDAAHTDTYLNNLGGGGITGSASAGDVQMLRNGISDLGNTTNGLWAVAHGLYVPPGANNFFFNAKALTGTNYTG